MEIDFTQLTSDGDTLELEDGRVLRLRTEPDEFASINDYDSDGRIEWVCRGGDYGGSVRPDSFDGNARIIDRDNGYDLWWQPPSAKDIGCVWTPEEMRQEQDRITWLARYGFITVILELCDGRDAYGRHIVVKYQPLGGIEWDVDRDYLAEVCSELYAEMTYEPVSA